MVEKLEPKQVAQAAARGVAIALAGVGQAPPRGEWRIICGIPPVIFEAVLQADAAGNVTVASMAQTKTV
jgi:hypothetical protein